MIEIEPLQTRPRAAGKFLFAGNDKLFVRGVAYGTFKPGPDGVDYPEPDVVERDFSQMAERGINTVRTYTVPPGWLLDSAARNGLRVLVGLAWEQHVAFLADSRQTGSIVERVRLGVRQCAGHPAILGYAIGNEIPAPIVRWHGRDRVESFLRRLYLAAKAEDPGSLITYVNYPTTEYLDLSFVDFLCFNVYLESQKDLSGYLLRLHNLAGDRPLVLSEIGLDSRSNGCEAQAESLAWQIRTAFAGGCAGAFVFSWTDEWHRGGQDVLDWDFGLTARNRRPKPALEAVSSAFAEVPYPAGISWPRISVVVCSYNGESTIRDCLDGLQQLYYPDFEVVVVSDGSTDRTADIAREYPFRLIETENRGLSAARNTGMEAANGEIIAYTDDDAWPDPHWLTYLAWSFMRTSHAAIGGPNVAPPGDGPIAECVANAPGGPVHVLLTDEVAEHLPGCNLAIRKSCLEAIGGFDPQFRTAGDDVDVCWRLQERGWTLGFSPAAMVWHHRRNSTRTYWNQQRGYGAAEALLERKWPQKYNSVGHLSWGGRIYGQGITLPLGLKRGRIYQGVWGTAPFQSIYEPAPSLLGSLPLMPEWVFVVAALAAISSLGSIWEPLYLAIPLLLLSVGATLAQAVRSAARADFPRKSVSPMEQLGRRGLVALLHLAQPLARLWGRTNNGLTPWRRRGMPVLASPLPATLTVWSEQWQAPEGRLQAIEDDLRTHGARVRRSAEFDTWDLEVRGGALGGARLSAVVEEHGNGAQLVRFFIHPLLSPWRVVEAGLISALTIAAVGNGAWAAGVILGVIAGGLSFRALFECANAAGNLRRSALLTNELGARMGPTRQLAEAFWADHAVWSKQRPVEQVSHR